MSTSQSVDQFLARLKRRQIVGSNQTAQETAYLLRTVISNSKWTTAASLIQQIKDIAALLTKAQPVEFAVGNISRRVLHLIREEYKTATAQGTARPGNLSSTSVDSVGEVMTLSTANRHPGDSSMLNLLAEPPGANQVDYGRPCYALKQLVIQGIGELLDELDQVSTNLAAQSLEHIHSNETIMTIGRSKSVERFLMEVGKKRQFQVIVAEAAPSYTGHEMARYLATSGGIETLVITDAAIFALMARVNKVIIGCHAVTANGGLIAPTGTLLVASAAKYHSIPVCVVTGLYKLTPIYPENHDSFNLIGSPDPIVPFAAGDILEHVDSVNPNFDYVPPSLVSLFITNVGGHPPSYIYRLLGELYDQEDYYELSNK